MSSSKTRIQNYLRQNKISELFEEMMGKLIKDLPASPIYYLMSLLQEKEKKVTHIVREDSTKSKEKILEVSSNAKLWATAPVSATKKPLSPRDATTNEQSSIEGRKYEKPWLSKSKKSPTKTKTGSKLNQRAPAGDILNNSKPSWNQKTKISGDQMNDVVDGDDGVDLGLVYAKPKIVGESQVKVRSDAEEMEAELSISGKQGETKQNKTDATVNKKSSKISAKEAKRKRLEELRQLADESKPKSSSKQRSSTKNNSDDDDDALEVLEDADELINEGVKNPPKTGFVTGRSVQKSKEEIELVLNMSKFFDELGGMEGINQSQINGSVTQNKFADEDDDFESASQVTGPRRPVWEAPESEVESVASQLRSGRRSDIGVEAFVTRPGSAKKDEEPKVDKTKQKTSTESRPRTAPSSRPRSNVDVNISNGGRETFRVPDPKSSKSPRSRPTTPKGSVVGRTSRRMSQTSNHSDVISPKKTDGSVKDQGKK